MAVLAVDAQELGVAVTTNTQSPATHGVEMPAMLSSHIRWPEVMSSATIRPPGADREHLAVVDHRIGVDVG